MAESISIALTKLDDAKSQVCGSGNYPTFAVRPVKEPSSPNSAGSYAPCL